ncbi:MAG: DUF805 domain-containing protein [Dokdonella sp.]|nr:MAG: DUF805 domain-containing protein [Dokdonella sp.]
MATAMRSRARYRCCARAGHGSWKRNRLPIHWIDCSHAVAAALPPGGSTMGSINDGGCVMSWTQLLFSFEGRIGRAPYWYFVLAVTVLFGALFAWVGMSLFNAATVGDPSAAAQGGGIASSAMMLASLLVLWPSLAICAKRWHDVDKSAWWILVGLVPVVGGLVALVFNGFIAGTPGANRFGNPPA